MTENNLVELYCIIDDFYQRFIETPAGKKNIELYYGKRGPLRRHDKKVNEQAVL